MCDYKLIYLYVINKSIIMFIMYVCVCKYYMSQNNSSVFISFAIYSSIYFFT